MILAESLLLALFGTGLGILAGVWLSYVLVGAMNFSGFVMQFNFPWGGVLAGLAVGLIFGVLAATLPARQAARLDIIHALRFE
jgi:putative ABC transport system permease protein